MSVLGDAISSINDALGAYEIGSGWNDITGATATNDANREWLEYMSSTAHQREVADLIAAGLNPVLSASGGSGAVTPSGSTAMGSSNLLSSAISTASSATKDFFQANEASSASKLQSAQTGLTDSQNALNRASARSLNAEAEQQEIFNKGLQKLVPVFNDVPDWSNVKQLFANFLGNKAYNVSRAVQKNTNPPSKSDSAKSVLRTIQKRFPRSYGSEVFKNSRSFR